MTRRTLLAWLFLVLGRSAAGPWPFSARGQSDHPPDHVEDEHEAGFHGVRVALEGRRAEGRVRELWRRGMGPDEGLGPDWVGSWNIPPLCRAAEWLHSERGSADRRRQEGWLAAWLAAQMDTDGVGMHGREQQSMIYRPSQVATVLALRAALRRDDGEGSAFHRLVGDWLRRDAALATLLTFPRSPWGETRHYSGPWHLAPCLRATPLVMRPVKVDNSALVGQALGLPVRVRPDTSPAMELATTAVDRGADFALDGDDQRRLRGFVERRWAAPAADVAWLRAELAGVNLRTPLHLEEGPAGVTAWITSNENPNTQPCFAVAVWLQGSTPQRVEALFPIDGRGRQNIGRGGVEVRPQEVTGWVPWKGQRRERTIPRPPAGEEAVRLTVGG